MTDDIDDLAAARQSGRLAAERLDRELRAVEERERRRWRLERLPEPRAPAAFAPASPAEVERWRREVEELAAFRAAVLGSRAWRVIQLLRRLIGRSW
jgi:hypothetical protein